MSIVITMKETIDVLLFKMYFSKTQTLKKEAGSELTREDKHSQGCTGCWEGR